MKRIILVLLIAFVLVESYGQMPEMIWQNCLGTSDTDKSYGVIETDNGYLFALGVSDGTGLPNYHGGGDIWLVETDTLGNKKWENCYGGSEGDGPHKLIKNNEDYFILASTNSTDGDVQSPNNGGLDYWVLKLDSEKEIIWEKCFGTPYNELPRDMIVTPDGGVVVMGRIFNSGGDVSVHYGSNDVWMFKTDSLGNLEWEKTLGNDWNDNGISIMLNSENNIMLMGAVDHYGGMVECGPDNYYGDVWLVEIDLLGNIVSQHCYGGSSYEYGVSIKETEYGYVFLANSYSNDGDVSGHHGPAGVPPNGWDDLWIVKLNHEREIIWQNSFGGYDSDNAEYITQTTDGGLLAIGWITSNNGDVNGNHSEPGIGTDIWAVKLDQNGEIEWQQCYGGWGSERLENPHTILKKSDYNYVIASSTDFGPSADVQCTPTGGNGIDRDAWIFEIDLEDTTNVVEQMESNQPVKVYPNPAKDYVIFEIHGSNHPMTRSHRMNNGAVTIMDVYGQEVATKQITSEKTVFDLRQFKKGIYFYRIYPVTSGVEAEGINYSGKIIVQR